MKSIFEIIGLIAMAAWLAFCVYWGIVLERNYPVNQKEDNDNDSEY
ncbi:hypothetical protein MADRUGA_62 [Mycobacterium phage Madruga]|uniref:Uncharacterized protein n=1 Tax=Mycobacterium phage Madruga TaxID=1675552 RepID=A0A0K1LS20_9CAUD|nr:hypothetical protein MADRUGA_62 [Mycobacterium phage Madruga]UOW93389.1 hypothetical protein SEA_LABELLE_63 [Mycobacterium phage Labelle]